MSSRISLLVFIFTLALSCVFLGESAPSKRSFSLKRVSWRRGAVQVGLRGEVEQVTHNSPLLIIHPTSFSGYEPSFHASKCNFGGRARKSRIAASVPVALAPWKKPPARGSRHAAAGRFYAALSCCWGEVASHARLATSPPSGHKRVSRSAHFGNNSIHERREIWRSATNHGSYNR